MELLGAERLVQIELDARPIPAGEVIEIAGRFAGQAVRA